MATPSCPPPSSAARMAATCPSIMPLGATTSAPGLGLGQSDALVELERRVVEDLARRAEDAAVPVVGVLVEAEVGHEDELVTHRVAHGAQRDLHDALRVPRAAPLGVLARRDAEEDEPGHAQRDESFGLDDERVERVLHLTGHGRDRDRPFGSLAHEERGDEVVDPETGLGHQPPQRRRAAQAAQPAHGKAARRGRRRGLGHPPSLRTRRPRRGPRRRSARRRCPGPTHPRPRARHSTRPHGPPRPSSARCTRRAPAGPPARPSRAQRQERLHRRGGGEGQRVGRGHPLQHRRLGRGRGARCGRPSTRRTSQPFWPSPSGMVSGARSAQGNRHAPRVQRPRSRGTPRRAHAHCARPEPGRARCRPRATRRPWRARRLPPTRRSGRARRAAHP